MYYLKTFEVALLEIARHLTADLGASVDLIEGSILRSLSEAVAFQAADLSERQERSISDAIPDAVFSAFGFDLLPALYATGTLTLSAPVPARDVIFIPAGAEAISVSDGDDEVTYRTTADAFIVPGALTVDVPAVATTPGQAGNAPAFSVIRLATGVPGVQSVTNAAPFTGGRDEENREARAVRFALHLAQLDRSGKVGQVGAILAAETSDGATCQNALVLDHDDDPNIPPGLMEVHAYRRGGAAPALQDAVRAGVRATRAGGIVPRFTWTLGTPVAVRVMLDVPEAAQREQAKAQAQQAVAAYFDARTYGSKVSFENLIALLTDAHPGIREVTLLSPAADVPAGMRERLELGTLEVTA